VGAMLHLVASACAFTPSAERALFPRRDIDGLAVAKQLLAVGGAVLISSAAPVLAADEVMTTPQCKLECNKECNAAAPGNKDYCATNCDDYCESFNPGSAALAIASDTKPVAAAKDCSKYKSKEALQWCDEQNEKALAPVKPGGTDLGAFGDLGVTYSKGVEDLFATAFGATRQNKNVKEADVGAFAGDIGTAALKAIGAN